jgi:hypothetical protein
MAVPTPASAVAAFASFVRERLADVGGTLAPLWTGRADTEVVAAHEHAEHIGPARHLAMVIIGAAAPFAPTSHARARLLRQAHASGLLTDREAEQALLAERLAITGQVGADAGSAEAFGASG